MGPTILAAFLLGAQQVPASDTLLIDLGDEVAALQVEERLRIGSLDGPLETTFGRVAGVAEMSDGQVVVADGMTGEIRLFDSSGGYLRDIGGKGQGPGEFTGVFGMGVTPADELCVWDFNSNRLSIFGPDGRFVRSFQTEASAMIGGPGPSLIIDQAGDYLVRVPGEPPGSGALEAVYAWLRYNSEGEFVDSLFPPRRRVSGSLNSFKYETLSAPSPAGYFVSGRNEEYALYRPLADGRVVRLERGYDPVALEGEEREEWEANRGEWNRRWPIDSPRLPRFKPALRSLYVDADGRIWVQRYAQAVSYPDRVDRATRFGWPNRTWLEPTVYDVIDPRGRYLGTVTFPTGSEVKFARDSHVWIVERGEFEEDYVVLYVASALPDED